MKLSKSEIRREIEKISSNYNDEEIFSSQYFQEILQAIVTGACEPLKRIPKVTAFYDQDNDFTACTEGTTVTINTMGPLIKEMDTKWDKYVNNVGHVIHECGHVLFTDFIEYNQLFQNWFEGNFSYYPEMPEIEGHDPEAIAQYLDSHPNYRRMLINEMKNIENIMEDVYIENRLFEKFSGVATLGLARSRQELYRLGPTENELYDNVLNGVYPPLTCYSQILLTRRTGYPLKTGEALNDEQKQVKKLIDHYIKLTEKEIESLAWESNGTNRCRMLNSLLIKLKPLLPEPPDNQDMFDPFEEIRKMLEDLLKQASDNQDQGEGQSGNSQSSEGQQSQSNGANNSEQPSNDYSEQQASQAINQSNTSASNAGMTQAPDGWTSPVDQEAIDKQASEKSRQHAQEASSSSEACKRKFEEAVKAIARKEFEEIDEARHSQELQEEANEIKSQAVSRTRGSCDMVPGYMVERISDIDYYRNTYDNVYHEVSKTAKHLAKKLSNLLINREIESVQSGYLMGQRFNARDVVHNDGKYFSRISEPDGKLRTCFGILVDESGSMYGRKSEDARRATILLEDALRDLDVSLMICGHTTKGSRVLIRNYVDFDTNDGKDRYRLAQIKGMDNNIDGAAITYMAEKLLKRPEEQKVLIVISDGMPCGSSFYSEKSADEDTALAIKHYRKKGINIFGAVVDEWERVSSLYGDQYSFDCRTGEELERQLIRLVKKYLKNY